MNKRNYEKNKEIFNNSFSNSSIFYFCGGPDKLRKGDEALNSEEYEKALHFYTESLEESPTNSSIKERIARYYYWLGETSYGEGKIEKAIEYLKKSGIEDAYLKLAEIYYEEGDKNFEKEQYEEAIKNYIVNCKNN